MKPLVISHAYCTDGFGAAFAAWMKFGNEAEYVFMNYGEDIKSEFQGREVYILDFSFPRDIMDNFFQNAKRVVWLDHHRTAFESWCGQPMEKYEPTSGTRYSKDNYILLDNNKSGALLAWEYFHGTANVPMLIKHIDDRDRWQFKLEGSKELHAALAAKKPWSFEQWKYLCDDPSDDLGLSDINLYDLKHEGAAILRAHEQNVKTIVESGRRDCVIPVYDNLTTDSHIPVRGLATTCPPYAASDVGHELALQSGTFGLCWYMGRDGKAKCSLRSNGAYDVSAIAKAFGGGGHQNAAGFEVPMETLMGWMK